MTQPAILDLDHLRQYTGGDPALEVEIFGLFREQCELWLKTLDPTGDVEAWKAGAHAIKGTAKGVGAFALAAACEHAETVAGDAGTPVARSLALQDLRGAVNDAIAAIGRHDVCASSSFLKASQASSS